MGSMICRLYPSLDVWLQIFVLWQFCFESGEEVVLVMMSGPWEAVRLHDPRLYDRVVVVILLH